MTRYISHTYPIQSTSEYKNLPDSRIREIFAWEIRKEKCWFILHFHISHNAPYLPLHPQILHNLCFSFLLGITAAQREIENTAYANFLGGK